MPTIDSSNACVNCGGEKYQQLFHTSDFTGTSSIFTLIACTKCGLVKTSPELSENELSSFYDNDYYGSGNRKFSRPIEKIVGFANRSRAKKILRHTARRRAGASKREQRCILDFGCGRALLLKEFLKFGCNCYGLERADFKHSSSFEQIEYFTESFEDIPIQKDYFDAIIFWHVLEHLPEPVKTIKEAVIKLKPGGVLVISVPNFESYQAFFFKQHWFHLDVPRHTYHFSATILKDILGKEQLRLLSKTTFSLEQNPYGFIQSLLNKFVFFSPPNKMYSLLKNSDGLSNKLQLFCWLLISALAAPLALAEYIFSGILGKGATVTYIMRKKNVSDERK